MKNRGSRFKSTSPGCQSQSQNRQVPTQVVAPLRQHKPLGRQRGLRLSNLWSLTRIKLIHPALGAKPAELGHLT